MSRENLAREVLRLLERPVRPEDLGEDDPITREHKQVIKDFFAEREFRITKEQYGKICGDIDLTTVPERGNTAPELGQMGIFLDNLIKDLLKNSGNKLEPAEIEELRGSTGPERGNDIYTIKRLHDQVVKFQQIRKQIHRREGHVTEEEITKDELLIAMRSLAPELFESGAFIAPKEREKIKRRREEVADSILKKLGLDEDQYDIDEGAFDRIKARKKLREQVSHTLAVNPGKKGDENSLEPLPPEDINANDGILEAQDLFRREYRRLYNTRVAEKLLSEADLSDILKNQKRLIEIALRSIYPDQFESKSLTGNKQKFRKDVVNQIFSYLEKDSEGIILNKDSYFKVIEELLTKLKPVLDYTGVDKDGKPKENAKPNGLRLEGESIDPYEGKIDPEALNILKEAIEEVAKKNNKEISLPEIPSPSPTLRRRSELEEELELEDDVEKNEKLENDLLLTKDGSLGVYKDWNFYKKLNSYKNDSNNEIAIALVEDRGTAASDPASSTIIGSLVNIHIFGRERIGGESVVSDVAISREDIPGMTLEKFRKIARKNVASKESYRRAQFLRNQMSDKLFGALRKARDGRDLVLDGGGSFVPKTDGTIERVEGRSPVANGFGSAWAVPVAMAWSAAENSRNVLKGAGKILGATLANVFTLGAINLSAEGRELSDSGLKTAASYGSKILKFATLGTVDLEQDITKTGGVVSGLKKSGQRAISSLGNFFTLGTQPKSLQDYNTKQGIEQPGRLSNALINCTIIGAFVGNIYNPEFRKKTKQNIKTVAAVAANVFSLGFANFSSSFRTWSRSALAPIAEALPDVTRKHQQILHGSEMPKDFQTFLKNNFPPKVILDNNLDCGFNALVKKGNQAIVTFTLDKDGKLPNLDIRMVSSGDGKFAQVMVKEENGVIKSKIDERSFEADPKNPGKFIPVKKLSKSEKKAFEKMQIFVAVIDHEGNMISMAALYDGKARHIHSQSEVKAVVGGHDDNPLTSDIHTKGADVNAHYPGKVIPLDHLNPKKQEPEDPLSRPVIIPKPSDKTDKFCDFDSEVDTTTHVQPLDSSKSKYASKEVRNRTPLSALVLTEYQKTLPPLSHKTRGAPVAALAR